MIQRNKSKLDLFFLRTGVKLPLDRFCLDRRQIIASRLKKVYTQPLRKGDELSIFDRDQTKIYID